MARRELTPDLVAELRSRITAGALRPGQILPQERQLAALHGYSRQVVRKAIAALAEEGMLVRLPGRGAIVQSGRLHHRVGWFGEPGAHLFDDIAAELRRLCDERSWPFAERRLGAGTSVNGELVEVAVIQSDLLQRMPWRQLARVPLLIAAGLEPHPDGPLPARAWTISGDRRAAGEVAVRHLVSTGCRQLAYVGLSDPRTRRPYAWEPVWQGMRIACEVRAMEPRHVDARQSDLSARLMHLRTAGVDGLVLDLDWRATIVYPALRRIGWRIGPGLRIVGVGGTLWAGRLDPVLTTVDLQPRLIARAVINLVADPEMQAGSALVIKPVLRPGASA
jgi:hypothetical protein